MNTRIILASASFLVLGALTAAPSFASVERAVAPQLVADDSADTKLDDGSQDKGSGDVSLANPSAASAQLVADDSADTKLDDGSVDKGSGDVSLANPSAQLVADDSADTKLDDGSQDKGSRDL